VVNFELYRFKIGVLHSCTKAASRDSNIVEVAKVNRPCPSWACSAHPTSCSAVVFSALIRQATNRCSVSHESSTRSSHDQFNYFAIDVSSFSSAQTIEYSRFNSVIQFARLPVSEATYNDRHVHYWTWLRWLYSCTVTTSWPNRPMYVCVKDHICNVMICLYILDVC